MNDKLAMIVLGNRRSGKTTTWNTLFGHTVRTSQRSRRLRLTDDDSVEVFLVSGSPEERDMHVDEIIGDQDPRIVLCSAQYRASVKETIDYFAENGFAMYVQWLNPGFRDAHKQEDDLVLVPYLLERGAVLSVRDGQGTPDSRVVELREFLHGWARARELLIDDAVRLHA